MSIETHKIIFNVYSLLPINGTFIAFVSTEMLVVTMRRQSCKPKVLFPSWFRFFVLILFIAKNAHSQYVLPNIENNFKAAFFKIGNLSCETNFQKFSRFSCFFNNKTYHFEAHILRVEIQI